MCDTWTMKRRSVFLLVLSLCALALSGLVLALNFRPTPEPETASSETAAEDEYEAVVPPAMPVSATETQATPADQTGLGGYDVLIADRGNNRIIEVTPDKKIVWEYDFDLPRPGLGADDAFFADGGKTIIAGLEEWQTIQLIDYATK